MNLDDWCNVEKPKEFDLSKIVKDGSLYIVESKFLKLTEEYGMEKVMEFMSDAVDKYNIPVPMKDIDINDLYGEYMALRALHSGSVIKKGPCYTKLPYDKKYSNNLDQCVYFSKDNTGNKASDYFQQENRMKCSGRAYPSPWSTWNDKKLRMRAFRPIWTLKMNAVNRSSLLTSIQMKHYIASQFRPSAAKAIYEYFGGGKVLDFSSGWGDRLCGFFASDKTTHYMGCDPNTSLIPQYKKQIEFYTKCNRSVGADYKSIIEKEAIMIPLPAEDANIPENTFDICFTSPPYFNVEKYSIDEAQSFARYGKVEEWLEGFMYPVIQKCWKALKTNGILAINISDIIQGSYDKVDKVCDPMNDYISEREGATYVGEMGYELSKRPNTGYDKDVGALIEPMWVWKKK